MEYINQLLGSNFKYEKAIIITTSANKYKILKLRNQQRIIDHLKIMTEQEYLEAFGYKPNVDNLQLLIDNNPFSSGRLDVESAHVVDKCITIVNSLQMQEHFLYDYLQQIITLGYVPTSISFPQNYQVITFLPNISDLLRIALPENAIVHNNSTNAKNEIIVSKYQYIIDEINGIIEEISLLLKNGVDFQKIEIIAPRNYHLLLKQIADNYQIPLSQEYKVNLINFLDWDLLQSNLSNDEQIQIEGDNSQEIINVINEFVTDTNPLNYYQYQLKYKLETTAITVSNQDGIKLSSDINQVYTTQDHQELHLFILGNYQDGVVRYQQDIGLIDDSLKEKYQLPTTTTVNQNLNAVFNNLLNSFQNIYISYSSKTVDAVVEKSYLLNSNKQNLKDNNYVSIVSATNDLLRYAHNRYILRTYNIKTPTYERLNQFHKITEKDNRFDGVAEKFDNLNLSYTSINEFYKCQYRFYLSYILRINPQLNLSNSRIFGEFIHSVLEQIDYLYPDLTAERIISVITNYLKSREMIVSALDQIYLQKFAIFLIDVCNLMKAEELASDLKDIQREEKFDMLINEEHNIHLVGKIDKIMSKIENDNLYVEIYDYKTGSININFDNVEYGLDMQNLIYFLLIKNYYKNEEGTEYLLGTYQQQIRLKLLKSKVTEEDRTKINGYSINTDQHLFKRKTKLLTTEMVDKLVAKTEEKVIEASNKIHNGEFTINPKILKRKNLSCAYCNYFAICKYQSKDLVDLEQR